MRRLPDPVGVDRRRRIAALAVLLVVVVAGGAYAALTAGGGHPPGDPDGDRLGWENGYWYDDPVAVTPGDGFNESEREAVVSRAMARLERIRELEFNETVPVSVISRAQYRANRSGGGGSTSHETWNDQVWEGLFVVGESTGSGESFDSTLGAAVQGYYSPGRGEIVIVSDSSTPTIDRGTLVHELVHALQSQHFGLGAGADTQDEQLAVDGLIEGEANYLQATYDRRCRGGWRCVSTPSRSGGDGGSGESGNASDSGESGSGGGVPDGYNTGLFLTIYQPYATGPEFVDRFRERSGWSAVNDLYGAYPDSTEQVIHPKRYPDEKVVNVTVPDRSSDGWHRFDHDPVADTVGEASIYAMFVSNDVVTPANRFEYRSKPSNGWGGDALVPYRKNGTAAGEGAYVWKTVWDSERDARQFREAYRDLLAEHDARNPRGNVYVVPDSDPFGDAFRVTRSGKTVLVVNAPTVDALDGVHAPQN